MPQPLIDDKNHVLLSTLDESIIENNYEFHLSTRMFPGGVYEPKGHKYLRDFESDPNPRLVYRIGSIVFSPLDQGLLTNRYLKDIPADSRFCKVFADILDVDQLF